MAEDIADKLEVKVEVIEVDPQRELDEHLQNSSEALYEMLLGDTCTDGHICEHCGKVYKTSSTLTNHRQLKHPAGDMSAQCAVCSKEYPSAMSLQKHIQYKHRYKHRCGGCYKSFESTEALEAHEVNCGKSEIECPHCKKHYSSQMALRNHVNYKHPGDQEFWCNLCRRTYRSARALGNHVATVHRPGATDCTWCSRSFASIPALKSHILYRHKENVLRCQTCHKKVPDPATLARHVSRNHLMEKYLCGVCVAGFENCELLEAHFTSTHGSSVTPEQPQNIKMAEVEVTFVDPSTAVKLEPLETSETEANEEMESSTTESEPNEQGITFTTSVKGNRMLNYKGYRYTKQSQNKGKSRWTCSSHGYLSCRAVMFTDDNDHIIKEKKHNHLPLTVEKKTILRRRANPLNLQLDNEKWISYDFNILDRGNESILPDKPF